MRLRKLICILGLGTVLMLAAACGSSDSADSGQTQENAATEENTEGQETTDTTVDRKSVV